MRHHPDHPRHMIDAFRQGLNETGYVVGQNVAFEHRAAGSEYDRFRAMADDLVRRQVAVIFATGGTAAALAARTATSTIPIVFYMGGDPVQQGLVASLSRPGGNITGFGWLGFALAAKRLELLRELLPNGATIGLLVNPANPDSDFEMRDVQDAARILGRQIHILTASSDGEFDGVFATLVKQQIGALIVASDVYFSGRRVPDRRARGTTRSGRDL
jgi:putative ABC transport system substrate-binding protein